MRFSINSCYLSVLAYIFLCACAQAVSIEPQRYGPVADKFQTVASQLEYVVDIDGTASLEQVVNGNLGEFQPLGASKLGHGNGKKVFWLRFVVDFNSYQDAYWFLSQNYEHLSSIAVFYPTDAGFQKLQLIEENPVSNRPYKIHNYLFKVPKPSTSSATYYVRYDPGNHWISLDFSWGGSQGIIENIYEAQLLFGICFGGLLVMWFYNAILCLYLRDKTYLYYIYYLGCLIAVLLYTSGYGALFFTQNEYVRKLFGLFGFGCIHAVILFGRTFLDLKNSTKKLDMLLKGMQWVIPFSAFFVLFLNGSPWKILTYPTVIVVIALIIASIIRIRQGYVPARLYITGWAILGLGAVLFALKRHEIIPANQVTSYAIFLASLLEAVLFAMALAYRIKLISLQVDAAKESFWGTISHELRTPLQTIIGCAESLEGEKKLLSRKTGDVIDRLVRASDRLDLQLRDLTEYQNAVSGNLSINKSAFNATEVVNQILVELSSLAEKKGLHFEIDLEPSTADIVSDPLRLQQIVANLVTNAIKYTEQGTIAITLRFTNEKQPMLSISVIDTGLGIDKQNLKKIFEPFTQIDHSLTRKQLGLGMGLTIVKSLVKLLDGTINVASDFGVGSTFNIEIPCEFDMSNRRTNNVLLIDDTEDARDILKEYVEKCDYVCDVASCGAEGLKKIKEKKYDIVFLDINMPDIDGYQVAKKVRSSSCQNKNIDIVCISARDPDINSLKNKKLFNYFLRKPIRLVDIKNVLDKVHPN